MVKSTKEQNRMFGETYCLQSSYSFCSRSSLIPFSPLVRSLLLSFYFDFRHKIVRRGDEESKNIPGHHVFSQNDLAFLAITRYSLNKSCSRNKRNRSIIILPAIQFQNNNRHIDKTQQEIIEIIQIILIWKNHL